MTKSELLGQILMRISGGVLTPDVTTRRGEAETYLAMAVNYVMTGNYWLEARAEGEKTINPLLLTTFDNVAIQFSEPHGRYYVDLPARVITLPKGRAFDMTTMCGKQCFPLGQGDNALQRFYGQYKSYISYEIEGVKRVWLDNVPKLVTGVRPRYIVHVGDVADDAEILLPSDGDVKVIDLVVNFLNGEQKEPKDYKEDGKS